MIVVCGARRSPTRRHASARPLVRRRNRSGRPIASGATAGAARALRRRRCARERARLHQRRKYRRRLDFAMAARLRVSTCAGAAARFVLVFGAQADDRNAAASCSDRGGASPASARDGAATRDVEEGRLASRRRAPDRRGGWRSLSPTGVARERFPRIYAAIRLGRQEPQPTSVRDDAKPLQS